MTSSSAALFGIVVVVSAATSALVGVALTPEDAPVPGVAAPERAGAPEVLPVAGEEVLRAELSELRQRLERVTERLHALEKRPAATARTPVDGWVTKEEFEALRARLQHVYQPWVGAEGPPPEFKQQVAQALTAIRKDDIQKKHEERAGTLEQRVSRLAEKLHLDSYQTSEMRTILTAGDERNRALIQMWQEGVDDQILGETKQSNARELRTEAGRVLTPQQLATWLQMRGEGGK